MNKVKKEVIEILQQNSTISAEFCFKSGISQFNMAYYFKKNSEPLTKIKYLSILLKILIEKGFNQYQTVFDLVEDEK